MLQSFWSTSILFVLAALAFGTGVYSKASTERLLTQARTAEGVVERVEEVDWTADSKAHIPIVVFEIDGERTEFQARPRATPIFEAGQRVTVVLPAQGSDAVPLVREEIADRLVGLYVLGAAMTIIALGMFAATELGRRRSAPEVGAPGSPVGSGEEE